MGEDSVKPFLLKKGKWVILLALTSNPGSADFQLLQTDDGTDDYSRCLFENVLSTSKAWATDEQLMYV